MKKAIQIFGGGTFAPVLSHFALAAPAFGSLARRIALECERQTKTLDWNLHLTKMADPMSSIITNVDLASAVASVVADPLTKIIFFTCAVTDYEPRRLVVFGKDGNLVDDVGHFGKHAGRLVSAHDKINLACTSDKKIVETIRATRKDIFLVACKTTCGASQRQMYLAGLDLCKRASVNLVLVNDVRTRFNMIVTPEEAAYHETDDRDEVIRNLVEMTLARSHLTFTRSTVIGGKPLPWKDPLVPKALRTVVDYCVQGHAYKGFNGATVGHFACRLTDRTFLTSIRRTNFNKLDEVGLVFVKTDGPDTVLAFGAKPSVGGQSQRIVFHENPALDCIVHFHCPLREDHPDKIPIRSQRLVECGSHECGRNTADGLAKFGKLKAVYLDQHGPNILFSSQDDPNEVIDFIERNFDLSQKTGGYQL